MFPTPVNSTVGGLMTDASESRGSSVPSDGLDWSEGPRLELDQLLAQLVSRAQDVMAAQGRLRGLLAANQMIITDLALPVLLRRIAQAACRLVNARYAALGVLSPAGGLEQFIHVGVDDDTVGRIGHLPTGKGLLGALIDDPHPIRLERIADDPRSVGFPDGHPPMSSFLGVPIRVRDEVFGNLYLSESATGEFTADDEEVVTALAATAGVAVENARLFEQARKRQDWLQAATRITRQLLSDEGEEPLQLIARQVQQIADADIVTVVLPTPAGERFMVEVAAGDRAQDFVGMTYPVRHSLVELVSTTRQPALIGDVTAQSTYRLHLSELLPVGPVMVLPLIGNQDVRGALAVGRRHGRHPFDEADLDMATAFANHAALALELADARADQQNMLLLEDRDRIARDLHDHVIQRLFAAGLTAQSTASAVTDERHRQRLERVVSDLDETIQQIRTTIFQLHGAVAPIGSTVRAELLEVVAQVSALLPFEPDVRFDGPIDAVVPDTVIDDLVAVTREALTNVARHAHATQATLALTADPASLILEVIDDGDGIGSTDRRSGLDNLRHRAENHGGALVITPAAATQRGWPREGTHLQWSIPLPK
jgi:two-component system, NarL family, sensor histidine kinase DevS